MRIGNISQNSFGQKTRLFTELPGLKCVMCGGSLLKMSEIDAFVNKVCGREAKMPSSKSINFYLSTMWHQKTSKLGLLSIMEEYAKKYPDKSFGEIFALPEVLNHHLQKCHAYYAETFEKNRPLFELMEKNLHLSPEQKTKLAELHKKAVNISISNRSDELKRYLIRQNYAQFQREISGTATAKIIEYASRMPLLPSSPDLALAHMAGKSDTHIMQGFLCSVTPMKKLINPNDGHGIFMCQHCASDAGTAPFSSLFYIFPKMFSNIQEQLNTIISYLARGELKGHGDYPKVLQRLISEATKGEKVLSLGKYAHQRRKIAQIASIPKSPQEIERLKQARAKRFENILLRETPDKIKGYIINAERNKRNLLAKEGVTQEQIKDCDRTITLLRKIYIQLLRRDKLI